eukprot:TRINITY_DN13454_c0_g1_i1.p1 TRINITY_DN13454_c0_g1~~TRINITY_DN13454_c0_g1_i1.p1  ORF type:complete len:1085 (+),score=346.47 TRINITY_DN13454_c0_g1_i1:317-3256(+)
MVEQFTEFRKKAMENERALKAKSEEQIAQLTTQLQQVKDAFQSRLQAFTEGQKGLEQKGYDALEELRKLKDDELEKAIQQYNEKYKSMLSKQLQAQEDQEVALNESWEAKQRVAEAKHKQEQDKATSDIHHLSEQNTSLSQQLTASNDMISATQAKLASLEEQLSTANMTEVDLNQTLRQYLKQLGDKEKALDASTSQCGDLQGQLEASFSNCSNLTEQLDKLKQAESKLMNAGSEREKFALELQSQIESITAEFAEKAAKYEGQLRETQHVLDANVAELASVRTALSTKEENCRTLEAEATKLKQRITSHEAEIDRVQTALRNAEELASEKQTAAANKIGTLERQLMEAEQMQKDTQAMLTRDMDGKCQSLNDDHERKMQTLKDDHEKAVREMREALKSENKQLAAQHLDAQGLLNSNVKSLGDKIEELTTALKESEKAAENAKEESMEQFKALQAESSQEINRLKEVIEQKRKELSELEEKLKGAHENDGSNQKAWAQKEEQLKATLAEMEQKVSQSEALCKKIQSEKEEEARNLRNASAYDLEKMKAKMASEGQNHLSSQLSKLKDDMLREQAEKLEHELQRAEHARQVELDNMRRAHKEIETALKAEAEKLNTRIEQLRGNMRDSEKQAQSDQDSWKEQRSILIQEHKTKEDSLKAMFAKDLEQLQERLKLEKKAAIAECKNDQEAVMSALRKEHVQNLNTLTIEHGKDLNELRSDMHETANEKLNAQKADLEGQKEAALKAQEAGFAAEKEEMKKAHKERLSESENSAQAVRRQMHDLEMCLRESNNLLEKERAAHENMKVTSRASLESSFGEYSRKVNSMAQEHEKVIQDLKSGQRQQVVKLTDEFTAVQAAMKQKHQDLLVKVAELEYQYANRESRDEDVSRINQLIVEISSKDEALIKAFNELRWYKLELVNREENYNRVFGRQPTVASGRPPAAMQEAADSRQARSGSKTNAPIAPARALSMVVQKTSTQ